MTEKILFNIGPKLYGDHANFVTNIHCTSVNNNYTKCIDSMSYYTAHTPVSQGLPTETGQWSLLQC